MKYSSKVEEGIKNKEDNIAIEMHAAKTIKNSSTSNVHPLNTKRKVHENKTSKRKCQKTKDNRKKVISDSKIDKNHLIVHQTIKYEDERQSILSDLISDKANSYHGLCTLTEDVLKDGLRVLLRQDGLFYPGRLTCILPPDIYGVLVDNERGNKPHVFSREEVINEAVSLPFIGLDEHYSHVSVDP